MQLSSVLCGVGARARVEASVVSESVVEASVVEASVVDALVVDAEEVVGESVVAAVVLWFAPLLNSFTGLITTNVMVVTVVVTTVMMMFMIIFCSSLLPFRLFRLHVGRRGMSGQMGRRGVVLHGVRESIGRGVIRAVRGTGRLARGIVRAGRLSTMRALFVAGTMAALSVMILAGALYPA